MTAKLEAIVLNRFAFGPTPNDRINANWTLESWLAQQLAPPAGDDPITQAALASVKLHIGYTKADGTVVSEDRPLQYLGADQATLWALTNQNNYPDFAERIRPADEIRIASMVRAVNSTYQLRETMAQFWHNHFSVNAYDVDQTAAGFPIYDGILRSNALGNFRVMLGQVAKSVTMMYFLNQQSSNRLHPNENYARELMELHTLGIINYYGTSGSNPAGYTDDDVIAAAAALTGWTIATGSITAADGTRPSDGRFIFAPSLHDVSPKTVLGLALTGTEGQQEGEKILDVLAHHPGTAQFLALKLCRFFVADAPPDSLIQAVASTWLANADQPNQIALAVQTILNSNEFAASGMAKVKDPLQFVMSALRATQVSWTPSNSYVGWLGNMGYPLYSWPTPDGIPTVGTTWTGTNGMLQRWNALTAIFGTASMTAPNFAASLPQSANTPKAVADFMAAAFLSYPASESSLVSLEQLAATSSVLGDPHAIATAAGLESRLNLLAAATLSLPEFQMN